MRSTGSPEPAIATHRQRDDVTRIRGIAWIAAAICLFLGWRALTALHFGPGATAISVRLLLSGIAFTGAAIYVRRRWGGRALAALFVIAVAGLAAVLGSAFERTMDFPASRSGAIAAAILLAPSLGAVALTVHRLAGRPSPMLQRDFPIGLAIFAIAQVIGVALALAVASLTIPVVGP